MSTSRNSHKYPGPVSDPLDLLFERDSYLRPYERVIKRRFSRLIEMEKKLAPDETGLVTFASGHEYFGLKSCEDEWIFREWAPNATALFLIGDMTGWQEKPSLP